MVVPWGYLGDERTLYRYLWSIREDAKTFGIDNNLQWRFGGDRVEHTVLAGLDYRRLESDYGYGFDFSATGLDAFDPVYGTMPRSEAPTSELQSLMRISYAVFCL